MARLTEKIDDYYIARTDRLNGKTVGDRMCLNKLGQLEDIEDYGKLVLFPTFAYFIENKQIHHGWVQEVVYSVSRKPLYDIRYDDNSLANHRGYLGNTVFLTFEEAEAALKNLQESALP